MNIDKSNMGKQPKMEMKSTTDMNEIQEWAEVRGGTPARDMENEKALKIIFPGDKDIANLTVISWEEFFQLFQENKGKFHYQAESEEEGTAELSRDYKIEYGS